MEHGTRTAERGEAYGTWNTEYAITEEDQTGTISRIEPQTEPVEEPGEVHGARGHACISQWGISRCFVLGRSRPEMAMTSS